MTLRLSRSSRGGIEIELDDAYSNGAYIPQADEFPARWAKAARDWVADMTVVERGNIGLPYGAGKREVFDLFLPKDTPRGLVVFVHGGYWREFDGTLWSHLAAGPVARGWAVVIPSYDLCPTQSIAQITAQIARAVTVAAQHVAGPIGLTGHSAGGHLVARMLAPEMLGTNVNARLHHVAPISPLADLRPLIKTTMNADLKLDLQSARAQSPLFQPVPDVGVSIWVGADERPAFLDQARWLARAWGLDATILPDRHHFDVIDTLTDPDSALVAQLTQSQRPLAGR